MGSAPVRGIDALPTLVQWAGGVPPTDRQHGGRNIWPILSGRAHVSPHKALFYFNGLKLEAVRLGPWKLAPAPQGTAQPAVTAEPVKHTGPRPYNLESDVGELTNVAARHPEVLSRLQRLI